MDAEGVGVVIISPDHEGVAPLAVDRAFASELGLVTGYHQPFVTAGMEIQIASFELERCPGLLRVVTPHLPGGITAGLDLPVGSRG